MSASLFKSNGYRCAHADDLIIYLGTSMSTNASYSHALRFSFLNALYDPVVALTSREKSFKSALLDGVMLTSGQRILDVGCGTGTLACMVARREPTIEMHGVDGDAKILERARQKAGVFGILVEFTHAMSFQLPFPDGHFDSVLSSLFFHHLNRDIKQSTLREIYRVLKPEGRLHIADWGMAHDRIMRTAFLAVQLIDGFETTTDSVHGKLPRMIEQGGFKDVYVEKRLRTMLGTMKIIRAVKPREHDLRP